MEHSLLINNPHLTLIKSLFPIHLVNEQMSNQVAICLA